MHKFLFSTCAALVAVGTVVGPAVAVDAWVEVVSRASVETTILDEFGTAAALDGGTLVVGAPQFGSWGEAYIFEHVPRFDAWRETQELSGVIDLDMDFGSAVAVSGDSLAVGALTETGAAIYLYQRDLVPPATVPIWWCCGQAQWGEVARLELEGPGPIVLVDDHLLVAGVPEATVDGEAEAGAVEVYRRSSHAGWYHDERLTASVPRAGERFGEALAAAGGHLLVGAPGAAELGDDAGAVVVFESQGTLPWVEVGRLFAGDGAAGDRFGVALSLDGATAMVGAPGEGELGEGAGAAYLFELAPGGTWSQIAKLLASDGAPGDGLGTAVALSGAVAVAGAPAHDLGEELEEAGAAWVWERDEGGPGAWGEVAKLVTTHPNASARFGESLVAAGDTVFAGVPGDRYRGGRDAGAIAQFARMPLHQGEICVDLVFFCDSLEIDIDGDTITGYWRNIDCQGVDLPIYGVIQEGLPKPCHAGDQGEIEAGMFCRPEFGCWVFGWRWYFMFDGLDGTFDRGFSVGESEPPGACGVDDITYEILPGPCPEPEIGGVSSLSVLE